MQLGKHNAGIKGVKPAGQYAVRLIFYDGHDSGLYTRDYLHELGRTHEQKWQQYLDRLSELDIPYPTRIKPR